MGNRGNKSKNPSSGGTNTSGLSDYMNQEIDSWGDRESYIDEVAIPFAEDPFFNHPPIGKQIENDYWDAYNEGDEATAKDLDRILELDAEMRSLDAELREENDPEAILKLMDKFIQYDDEITELYYKYY